MGDYKVVNITIKNEMGGILFNESIITKEDDITKRLIDILKMDIILEKGDTITIE